MRQLGIPGAKKIAVSSDRPNLFISVRHTAGDIEKFALLAGLLPRIEGSIIIYTATRKGSELVARWAKEHLGIAAERYHAGLEPVERTRIQEAFTADQIRLVAATNAFGMGIDKPDIRLVAHFHLPGSLEAYYQEIGRAGRDGRPALGLLLFSAEDKKLQEWMIEKDTVTKEDLAVFWRACARFADGSRAAVPVNVLAQQGLDEIKQQLIVSVLERVRALRLVEREPERLVVEPGPVRLRPGAVREILQGAERQLVYRKKKLAALINWASATRCRRAVLLEYFGEKPAGGAGECCDNCLKKAAGSGSYSLEPLTVLRCVTELPRPVGQKKLAEILTGARTFEITARRYNKLRSYGKLAGRKTAVLEMISRLVSDGYLQITGDEYPVLALTPAGKKALKNGKPLPAGGAGEKLILPAWLCSAPAKLSATPAKATFKDERK